MKTNWITNVKSAEVHVKKALQAKSMGETKLNNMAGSYKDLDNAHCE